MESNLENSESQVEPNNVRFYVVSQKKCLILFVGTLGLYSLYWFFKHWSEYKKSVNKDMLPVMRSLFSIFFVHQLFSLFEKQYTNKTGTSPVSIKHLATIYVISVIAFQVFSRLAENGYGNPFTFYFGVLTYYLLCLVLYKAQSLANHAGEDVRGESNSKLTGLNYFWLTLGTVAWFVTLFSLFLIVFVL